MRLTIEGSHFAVHLGPPPAHAYEQEAPIVEELRRLAFEGVSDKLEDPSQNEEAESIGPQAMHKDAADKQQQRNQDGRDSERVARAVNRMLVAGRILFDPLLVAAVAQHGEGDHTTAARFFAPCRQVEAAAVRVVAS